MYFLVEKSGELKLVRNFKKPAHKMSMLINYLNEHNISYVESKEDMTDEGKYCVPNGLNKYLVYVMKKQDDGYIFNGALYEERICSLEFVYYQLTEDKMIQVCEALNL